MYFLKLRSLEHCMYRNVVMVVIVVMKDLLTSQQSKGSLRIVKTFECKASGFIPVLLQGLLGVFSVFTATFLLLALPHVSHLHSSWRWYHLTCLASIQHLLFSTLRPLPWKCSKKDSFFLMICASLFGCLTYDFMPAQFTFWVAVFLSGHPERKMDPNTYETQSVWMHFLISMLCSSLGWSPHSAPLNTPFHVAAPWGWCPCSPMPCEGCAALNYSVCIAVLSLVIAAVCLHLKGSNDGANKPQ